MIASASFGSRRFVSLCVTAAAFLMRMTASTNEANGASWEMGKLRRGRPGWVADSAAAGPGGAPPRAPPRRGAPLFYYKNPPTGGKKRRGGGSGERGGQMK